MLCAAMHGSRLGVSGEALVVPADFVGSAWRASVGLWYGWVFWMLPRRNFGVGQTDGRGDEDGFRPGLTLGGRRPQVNVGVEGMSAGLVAGVQEGGREPAAAQFRAGRGLVEHDDARVGSGPGAASRGGEHFAYGSWASQRRAEA